jgi:hypothetical protein
LAYRAKEEEIIRKKTKDSDELCGREIGGEKIEGKKI